MVGALAVALVASPIAFAPGGGSGFIKVSTNNGTWTSGSVAVDSSVTITVRGAIIEVQTPTDEVISNLTVGTCTVTINQNGEFQATLTCSTPPVPAQRVYYAVPIDPSPVALGNWVVTPEAFFAYAEYFQSNPNTGVTFWHNITSDADEDCYRCVVQSFNLDTPVTWNDAGQSFLIPCTDGPWTTKGELQTSDGFHYTEINALHGDC
jgi:hypothetical protein